MGEGKWGRVSALGREGKLGRVVGRVSGEGRVVGRVSGGGR